MVSALLVVSVALDAVDGIVARRQGADGKVGSFVDVACDRFTAYVVIVALVAAEGRWRFPLGLLVARDVVVDAAKVATAWLGHSLDQGVLVSGKLRTIVVASPLGKGSYNVLKAGWFSVALLLGIDQSGSVRVLQAVVLALLVAFSLARGYGSVSTSLPLLRRGRIRSADDLTVAFGVQFTVGILTLLAVSVL